MACPACGCDAAWRYNGARLCYGCDRPLPLEPPSPIVEERVVVVPPPAPQRAEPTWVPAVERFEYTANYGYHQERLRLMTAQTDAEHSSNVQLVKIHLRAYHKDVYGRNTEAVRITEQQFDQNQNLKSFSLQVKDARLPLDVFMSGPFQFEPRLLVSPWSAEINFHLPDRFACLGHVEYYYQRRQ